MLTINTFYKFVPLEQLDSLRDRILQFCQVRGIKGSILIAPEGINGTVCGDELSISELRHEFENDTLLNGMNFKRSEHSSEAFRRMVVRIKKEIITMRKGGIDPNDLTGKFVKPIELKGWIDEGQELVFLDTRNNYEVKVGTFRGAIDPKINVFSEFPDFIDANIERFKNKKIITFCTGGIRCEKATAYMVQKGLEQTYQIDGGILKYFEDTKNEPGDNYWEGECVVFDKRLAVTKKLETTDSRLCYSCFSPADTLVSDGMCVECEKLQNEAARARFEKGKLKYAANLVKRTSHLEEMKKTVQIKKPVQRAQSQDSVEVNSGEDSEILI